MAEAIAIRTGWLVRLTYLLPNVRCLKPVQETGTTLLLFRL